MRFWKVMAIAVLASLMLLPFAAVAGAAGGMQIGVEDDAAFTGSAGNADRATQATRDLQAGSIRVIIDWADVGGAAAFSTKAPRRRHYNFHAYDGLVYRAQRHHIAVQVVLAGPAPAWATGNRRKGTYAPQAGFYGEFARQAAAWFGNKVARYSIWNEPNYVSWLSPQRSAPDMYRGLYTHAYTNIKRVNPNAQVLIGETSPYYEPGRAIAPLAFLRGVLCNGRCRLTTDGYAHHPYDFYHWPTYRYPGGDNVTIGTLSRLWSALSYWAGRGALRDPKGHIPQIYLTEFGYLSSGSGRIDDNRHAQYLQQAFAIALSTAHVRELVQYTLIPPTGRYAFFDMSILTSRWAHRKPFRVLAGWARGAEKKHLLSVPH